MPSGPLRRRLVIAFMSVWSGGRSGRNSPKRDKKAMLPLLRETWGNYLVLAAPRAFSGPLVRGDVHTVRKHLAELKRIPEARDVYIALARAAIERLPVKNKEALAKELRRSRITTR